MKYFCFFDCCVIWMNIFASAQRMEYAEVFKKLKIEKINK